jgi:hypothetical protein
VDFVVLEMDVCR